jgi:hypothetical protein
VGLITKTVTLQQAEKACQGQTLWLIGPIKKLRRKLSVVNTVAALLENISLLSMFVES